MVWREHDYDNIPGTYVFDGRRAHPAYALNKLLFSFNEQRNRDAFAADPAAYCDRMGVTGEQKRCVLENDFLGMLRLGANIYYVAKMAVPRGTSVQDAGAAFQGNVNATVFLYARLWRRSGVLTDLEFYELRYSGRPAAFLRAFRAVYLGVFFNVMIMATVTLAAIKIGGVILGDERPPHY